MLERADLTVVVPTYNERNRLAELVEALFRSAADEGVRLAVVIVDDNSPDGTGALADDLARHHRLKVIHRSGKLGLGTAVIEGTRASSTDIVGVMDADFSHPPTMVPRMYRVFCATGADMLVASRYIPGGSTPNWPWSRRLMSRAACLLARPLSPIRDATSGFFMMRRSIVEPVSIRAGGFKICLELLLRGSPERLVEMPFQFEDRQSGESKMSAREVWGYLVQLKALYGLRWSGGSKRSTHYEQLAPAEVERIAWPSS